MPHMRSEGTSRRFRSSGSARPAELRLPWQLSPASGGMRVGPSVEAARADQQRARSGVRLGDIPNAAPRSGLGRHAKPDLILRTDSQRNVSWAELHPLPAAGRDRSREMQRGTSVSCLSEGWVVSRGASSPGEQGAAPSWGNTPDATPYSGLACRPSRVRSYAATVNKMSLARRTALALASGTGRAVPRGLRGDFSLISEGFRTGPPRPESRRIPSPSRVYVFDG